MPAPKKPKKRSTRKKPAPKKTPPRARRPPGRPPYPEEKVIAALERHHGFVTVAAKELGCTEQTIRNHAMKNPAVQEIIDSRRNALLDVAEDKLAGAVDDREPWAVQFFLKTIGKDRGYVERIEQRHGGDKDAPPIQTQNAHAVIDVDALPLELRKQLLEHLRAQEVEHEEVKDG